MRNVSFDRLSACISCEKPPRVHEVHGSRASVSVMYPIATTLGGWLYRGRLSAERSLPAARTPDTQPRTELEIVAIEKLDCYLVIHVMPTHYRKKGR